jgi:hypothetical protein
MRATSSPAAPHEPDSNTAARLCTVCDPAGHPSLR